MKATLIRWLVPFFVAFQALALHAADGAANPPDADTNGPAALVKNVTNEVLDILRQDSRIQGGDTGRAANLIETKISPHFDFNRMTALAVGRAWRDADAGQRQALSDAFRTLLVRTYANALTSYKDQTVVFKPTRAGAGDTDILVQSQIEQPGSQPIGLDYRLVQVDGQWKVVDVTVANVSLVTTYRSNFATEINNGGIDGLIQALRQKADNPQAPAARS